MIFSLLMVFSVVTGITSVSGQDDCTVATTFVSRKVHHSALRNHVITTRHTGSLGRCAIVCQATMNCRSFNFNGFTGDCELNDACMDDFVYDMQTEVNSRYIQMVVGELEILDAVCQDSPCENGGTCKLSDCESDDIISCDCPEGYSGQYCQIEGAPCEDPGPATANVVYNVSAGGGFAYFWCDDGYILQGSSTLRCSHGNWSDDSPTCRHSSNPTTTLLSPTVSVAGSFVPHQDLNTFLSTSITSFTIATNHYVAVTSLQDGCMIYRLENGYFSFYQEILIDYLYDVEFATIGGQHMIFLAVEQLGGAFNTDSKIYVWDSDSFVFHDDVATVGANDWHYFVHSGVHYLALASAREAFSDYETSTSALYKWDTPTSSLTLLQNINTKGCKSVTSFLQNSKMYVVFSNSKKNDASLPQSEVFRLADDGNSLIHVQFLVASYTHDSATYSLSGNFYLTPAINYNTIPIVYKWNDATLNFDPFTTISSITYVTKVCPFQLIGRQFLLFAAFYNPATLLVDDGVSDFEKFIEFQMSNTPMPAALDCHSVTVQSDTYIMLVLSDSTTPVRIYRWVPT